MIFFAAGNAGQNGDRTITAQSTGKNSVSVGSSETTYGGPNITYVAFYSSKGPTYDNRYFRLAKPTFTHTLYNFRIYCTQDQARFGCSR